MRKSRSTSRRGWLLIPKNKSRGFIYADIAVAFSLSECEARSVWRAAALMEDKNKKSPLLRGPKNNDENHSGVHHYRFCCTADDLFARAKYNFYNA